MRERVNRGSKPPDAATVYKLVRVMLADGLLGSDEQLEWGFYIARAHGPRIARDGPQRPTCTA